MCYKWGGGLQGQVAAVLGHRDRCVSCQATVTQIKRTGRTQAHDSVSILKNWKFNTTLISARKNKPLFFSKPKLVQNIGLCGNSRLPAAQLRKPHDKANLKREESVCLLKVSQGKRVGFSRVFSPSYRTTSLSLGSIPVGLPTFLKNPKKQQVWAVSSQHPPPSMPHSSFLSSSCQWLLWTIRGWLSQRLRPQHLNLWPGSSNS